MKHSEKKKLTALVFLFCASLAGVVFFVWSILENPKVASSQSVELAEASHSGPRNPNLKIDILMYHHVGDYPENADATRRGLTVSTKNFNEQVAWLKQEGYHSVSLKDIYNYSQGRFNMPAKPVVFTFDDGYQDVFDNALPILEEHGFSGSFGVITEFQGKTMGDNIYASWTAIKSAQAQGSEVVCHTQNHFDGSNSKFGSDYIYQNLAGCKNDLKQQGIETGVLIYPYGHYTQDYIKQAQRAGFNLGLTVHFGQNIDLNKPMELPRMRVNGGVPLDKFKELILFGTF